MEEEVKKRQWGGKRAGAGRKKGKRIGHIKENPKSEHITFRVTANTTRRIKQLRELTKDDAMPFNRMFEAWVEEYAKDYGLE